MKVTYGAGFELQAPTSMTERVTALQREVAKLPQYEPITEHFFHGGMYCRKVFRDAGVLVVGKVHKKEHFYLIVSGDVVITTDTGAQRLGAGSLLLSKPGTKRAVYSETAAVCMTFHRTDATTIEAAELELVETDAADMYLPGNQVKAKELS